MHLNLDAFRWALNIYSSRIEVCTMSQNYPKYLDNYQSRSADSQQMITARCTQHRRRFSHGADGSAGTLVCRSSKELGPRLAILVHTARLFL